MHPKNRHQEAYDFQALSKANRNLARFVKLNPAGRESIDFSNPKAVVELNKALLQSMYDVRAWNIPEGYLCPPIPGRADYIHHIAELMGKLNYGKILYTYKTKCLDVGVGASCVYPIIGNKEYGWSFVGSDIDPVSLASSKEIVESTPRLKQNVVLRLQTDSSRFFKGVLKEGERFNLTICNPPFHLSKEDAEKGSRRKSRNLSKRKDLKSELNFGGQSNELWCEGGEKAFVRKMIDESREYGSDIYLFSTIVSKQAHIKSIQQALHAAEVADFYIIPMAQGQKQSRIVAWTFLTKQERKKWKPKA